MRNFKELLYLLALVGLMAWSGCSASRQAAAGTGPQTPFPPQQASSSDPEKEEASAPVQTEDPVQVLLAEAQELFREGESLFQEGRIDEGRQLFQDALRMLKNSEFDFFEHPLLESAYYKMLGQIREHELQVWIDPSEMQLPHPEPSPLDEIADLNLYTIEVDPHLKERVDEELLKTRFDIPVALNDYVLRFLNYYQTRGRKIMEEGLRRSGEYLPLFREIFEREGVPQDLIYMAHVESLFKPHAYSRARARGIWQFISYTGKLYGLKQDWWIDERSDVRKSTEAAARHLKDLYNEFQDWNLALAAYNGGARRIKRIQQRYGPIDFWAMAKGRLVPRETRNYVPSILASIMVFRNPEFYGFQVEPEEAIRFETVALDEQVDLKVAAELIDIPSSTLREYNPELRRGITPHNYPGYELKVPVGKGELLQQRLTSLPPEKKVRFAHHRVRPGETLSQIAGVYSTSIQAVAQVNRIHNVNRLRIGQDLIIPLSEIYSPAWAESIGDSPTSYTVRRGDSLTRIARRYRVSLQDLLRWNNLEASQVIYPGQTIRMNGEATPSGGAGKSTGRIRRAAPTPASYTVRRGDSLTRIARRHRVSLQDLLRWNNLEANQVIYPGQTIRILNGEAGRVSGAGEAPAELPLTYTVRRGDSLDRIARRHRVSLQDLLRWNNLEASQVIYPGQTIRILGDRAGLASGDGEAPAELPLTYTVRRGDSLTRIARRHRVSLQDLLRWNNLAASQVIYPGQTIRILGERELVSREVPGEAIGDQ